MTNPMWRDPNGNFSTSKFWTNVAYAVATYVVLRYASATNWEILLVYLSIVGGSEVGKKFLSMKYGQLPNDSPVPPPPRKP